MAKRDGSIDATLEGKAAAEALIPQFKFERLLNQGTSSSISNHASLRYQSCPFDALLCLRAKRQQRSLSVF